MIAPELTTRLQDNDETVVIEALRDICQIDEEQISQAVVEHVTTFLLHENISVSVQALETMQHLAQTSLALPKNRILNALTFLAKSSETPRVRGESAIALVLVDDPATSETVSVLIKLLDDEHPRVRQEAAAALGDSSAKKAIPVLLEHLSDPDEQTRFECSFALASMKDSRGLPLLLDSLSSSKRRIDALEGIRRLADKSALSTLEPLSRKFFLGWPERLTVLATMYAVGDKTVVPRITEKAESRNKAEKALAIGLIGTHGIVEAVEFLSRTIEKAEESLALQIIDTLKVLGTSEAFSAITKIASSDRLSNQVMEAAKAYVDARKN
ncbi:MAG: HEAT repeat domain-containing protein [Myxococcota bacterium]|nr:HEAT repeat domain-containing protein [Myxococcota bacterium]